ncbi:MAG: PorP/SprF family type IX secretion system membrane protein [Flavobacteriales bacterium]
MDSVSPFNIFPGSFVIKLIMVTAFFLGLTFKMFSQDPQFSQFYTASMYLNPAFTGNTIQHRFTSIYRNQWPSVTKAYVSYSFAYDQNVTSINSGVGIMFTHDKAGTGGLRYTNIGGLYSYYFQINKKLMARLGTKLSYTFRNYDQSKLRFNDQIITGSSSTIENLDQGISYLDFSGGGLLYSEKFWAGFAMDHLNEPDQTLLNNNTPLPIKFSWHGGYKFVLDEGDARSEHGSSVTVATNYKAQEKWDQLDLGTYFDKDVFTLGFWYRGIPVFKKYKEGYSNNDAVIILLGVRSKRLKIGYSYDITISKLNNNKSGGAHEISIVYEYDKKRKKRKKFFVPCAKF